MRSHDLRGWIQQLQDEKEIKIVEAEVSLDEIAVICRRCYDIKGGGPALLFKNITGFKEGTFQKLFTGGLSSFKRIALMLGLPKETPYLKLVEEVTERLGHPIKPVVVSEGKVKQNIIRSNFKLSEIPVPKWHPLDGGPYINTLCGVVTRDPEDGELNVGLYRGQVLDDENIGVLMTGTSHWGIAYKKYQRLKKDMPVAVAYGWDPVMGCVACAPVSSPEYDVMGGLIKKPVSLIKCETSDLLVPADAEIVIEGHISIDPSTYRVEGPFGEYTGYYGEARLRPVIKIDCITHRNDPIFRGTLEGMKPGMRNEDSYMYAVTLSGVTKRILDSQGVPGVLEVFASTVTYVKIRKFYRGHAQQVAAALWGNGSAQYLHKVVVVVDEDIDIHNLRALDWAMANRFNPEEDDLVVFPGSVGGILDPSIRIENRDEMRYGAGKWARMLLDLTISDLDHLKRPEWNNESYPPDALVQDEATVKLVEKRWPEYGI